MKLEVQHPAFAAQQLSVEAAGLFSGPKLLLNGAPVPKLKGRYVVKSDSGEDTTIELKYNWFDPIPKIKIAGELESLAEPLAWYEMLWIGAPVLLMFIGGAIGGFLGVLAVLANGRVFRGDNSGLQKYAYSALISAGAVVAWAAVAIPMQSLRQPSLEKQLQDVAAEFAKGGPRMVDKETRLDEVVAGPGLMLSYRYTAMAVSSANMPSAATFREFSSATTHKVCASDMKQLLEKKVALKYLYRERGGSPIGEFLVVRADCR